MIQIIIKFPNKECLYCTIESLNYNLCISCNNDNNFYQKYNDSSNIDNFIKCYNNLEGFFLYNNIYFECYSTCKTCFYFGNKVINNCSECKDNYIFINDTNKETNCYEKCNYYYYFDKYDKYQCTKDDSCPREYSKLIKEKNKCIDNCYNDNIYIFEYDNECYKSCPKGTTIFIYNTYICVNKDKLNDKDILNYIIKLNNNKDDIINNITNEITNGHLNSLISNIIGGEKKRFIIKR